MTEVSERLDALETRLAFQDQTIEDLNASVTELRGQADLLARKLGILEQLVRDGPGDIPDAESPPPHY
jgi:SlyX protein